MSSHHHKMNGTWVKLFFHILVKSLRIVLNDLKHRTKQDFLPSSFCCENYFKSTVQICLRSFHYQHMISMKGSSTTSSRYLILSRAMLVCRMNAQSKIF